MRYSIGMRDIIHVRHIVHIRGAVEVGAVRQVGLRALANRQHILLRYDAVLAASNLQLGLHNDLVSEVGFTVDLLTQLARDVGDNVGNEVCDDDDNILKISTEQHS